MQVRYCTCTVVLLYSTVMYTSHKIHEFNRMAKQLMYRMKWMINFVHVLNHGSLAPNFLPKQANQQYLPAARSTSQLGGEAMGIRTENEQLEPGLGVEHHGTSRDGG